MALALPVTSPLYTVAAAHSRFLLLLIRPTGARKQSFVMNFTFDDDAFKQVAQDAVRDMAQQQNRDLEALRQRYTGSPVHEIKPALQALFAGYDGNITEPNLSDWARLLSDGTKIEMVADPIDWNR